VFGRVFREILTAGFGLLPGRIPGSGGLMGREIYMLFYVWSCRNERREYLYGTNDSVSSGTSNVINDRRSGFKPWNCRHGCASVV